MRTLASLFLLVVTLPAADNIVAGEPEIILLDGADRKLHVQGIDVEGNLLWVSSVDRERRRGFLHLYDLSTGHLIRETEVQDGDRFHPGGISRDGGVIWVPVAEYRPASSSVIQKRDKRTLALLSSFAVDDHIGCVAAAKGLLVGGNWDSRDLYVWERKGELIEKRKNPSKVAYQDMKGRGPDLIASGTSGPGEGAIEFLAWPALTVRSRIVMRTTDRGVRYTNEGMTVVGNRLYLLPEDGPGRIFVFRLR